MKKSFKRTLAVLLAVIMAVCTMPTFTAFAAAGEYKPDIQLQFGTFWNSDATSPLDQENYYSYEFSTAGVYGPVIDYKNGQLVLSADKYAAWNDEAAYEDITEDYTLKTGDIFTVTARLDNVDKLSAFEAAISYSSNIQPLVDEEWGIDGTPFEANGADTFYEGINNGFLGDLSYVDAEKNVILVSASAQNGKDYAAVTDLDSFNLTDPKTGAKGCAFHNQAILTTFVFQVVDEGPISFGIYNGDEDSDVTYGGAFYIADATEGTEEKDYTTYQPVDEAIGSTDMTFMTKNEYVAPSGVTITFIDENGAEISSTEYEVGDTVTVPQLPKMSHDNQNHFTYAWDVTPAETAAEDATYTIVKTTTAHDYTKTVVKPETCNAKGTSKYTCKVCDYNFTVDDIAMSTTHTPAKAVEENRVEATCAKAGSYDSVVYCSVCNKEITRTPVTINKIDHTWGAYVFNGDAARNVDGTQTRECAVCHTTETVTAPNTGILRVNGNNLELSAGVAENFLVNTSTIKLYDKVWVEVDRFEADKNAYVKYVIEDSSIDNTQNKFQFTSFGPQGMADNLKVSVHGLKNGVEYWGVTNETSVRTYVMGQLKKQTTKTSAATLFVDLLNYGTAAQDYMKYNQGDYINSQLTEAQKKWGSTLISNDKYVDSQNLAFETIANPSVAWRGASLVLESSVGFSIDISDYARGASLTKAVLDTYKIKIQLVTGETLWYNSIENPECFTETTTKGRWTFEVNDIPVASLDGPFLVTVCDANGNALSNTLQYSAASYTRRQNGKPIKNLLDYMQVYITSAYNYTLKGGK